MLGFGKAGGDRGAFEAVPAAALHFTSQLDSGIGLCTYLERCWPTHTDIVRLRFVRFVVHGDMVLRAYRQTRGDGSVGRNTEVLTIRDGRIHAGKGYFGWSVPHPAAPGTHLAAG